MPLNIIRNDITEMDADVIVNAANTDLKMGRGVCGAIFSAAGPSKLQAACDEQSPIKTGEAVITPGFNLPAKRVIHTAGPIYRDGKHHEKEQLYSCYINSLKLAEENDCQSIAFPLISSGIYGYPKEEALEIATEAIEKFLEDHEMDVSLVIFDKAAFVASRKLFKEVTEYIDENYVDEHEMIYLRKNFIDIDVMKKDAPSDEMIAHYSRVAKNIIDELDEPFSITLLRLIDAKNKTDVEVYKKANINRKLFSKIRTNKEYMPSKRTAIALAIGLELTLEETDDLLNRAGYTLSHSQKFDVIVEYFILNGRYDIFKINEILFEYDQPLLGG